MAALAGRAAAQTLARTRRVTTGRGRGLPAALRFNKPEVKSVDLVGAPISKTVSTTATFNLMNGVQEGSSFYNRVGRKIMMRSLHLVGNITSSGNAAGVAEYLRLMVVYDRQPNGAAPAIADVLLDYDNAGTTTTTSYSALNMNNADRFQVLADIRIDIPVNAAAGLADGIAGVLDYTKNEVNVNRFVKLKNLETHYKSSTNPAVIGDISSGALWLVTFGNVANATAGYVFNFGARLRYHDV